MPTLRIVQEDGTVGQSDVLSRHARIIPDSQEELRPAVVQRVEYDHTGQTSSITSVCGETENRRESDEQPDITIEGILTEDQLSTAKALKEGQEITLVSDVHQGSVLVKRLTIEQNTDVISVTLDDEDAEKLAFGFQLQLGEPGTDT